MRITLTIACIILHLSSIAQRDSLRTYYQKGVVAYDENDYAKYLNYFTKANEIRPNHPTITYNLASAYALNGDKRKCLAMIKQMVAMNSAVLTKIKKDDDFSTIIDLAEYGEIEQYALEISTIISHSKVKQSIAIDSAHIEGITYNPTNNSYFLGAVNHRSLFEYSGSKLQKIIDHTDNENIYSILGLAYHSKSNSIWFCTTALPQMKGYSDSLSGYSSIFEYDLENKKIITEIVVEGGSAFGDLIINKVGQVFISDGLGNKIYVVESGESKLSQFIDLSASTFNLQGLTFSTGERYLFITDYITGIYKIGIADKSVVKITLSEGISEKGIDGLYFYNETLVAIQNGTFPYRIMQLNLNPKQSEITSFKILDQAREELNEPTQGAVVNGDFIYIANSPWGKYNDDNKITSSENLLLLSLGL